MFIVRIHTDAGEYINLEFQYKQLAKVAFEVLKASLQFADNVKSITCNVERLKL